jgi:hypothetical protein
MNVNYTYNVGVDGTTIYADVKNDGILIGTKKYSTTTYNVDRVTTEVKDEGDKWGFSFDGTYYPPQNNNTPPENTNPETQSTTPPPSDSNSDKVYEISRKTLSPTPDINATANSNINQQITEKEVEISNSKSELPPRDKLIKLFNENKETFKKILIPFIIGMLAAFGASVIQAVLADLPLDQILNIIKNKCPSQPKIRELIAKRDKLVVQLNGIYEKINILSASLGILSLVVSGLKLGVTAAKAVPTPAPAGVAAFLIESEKQINNISKSVNLITITAASFGMFLGIIIKLLNMLDKLLQHCAEDQNMNPEQLNEEINALANPTVAATQSENNIYKGFTLGVKIDETNNSKYIKRYAVAQNKQGIDILRTESSFASDPSVLVSQLKFIIDSSPNITAE